MRIDVPNVKGSGELYLDVMHILCGNTAGKSMIDLGCHKAPYTSQLGFSERTYVDLLNRGLDNQEEQKYFVEADMISYLVNLLGKTVDVTISSDSIEHLTYDGGLELLNWMRVRSRKQIIFTPLGGVSVNNPTEFAPDMHRSGWTPDMLPNYLAVVFPHFHPELNAGAWFGVNCDHSEKLSIYNQIKNKYGA